MSKKTSPFKNDLLFRKSKATIIIDEKFDILDVNEAFIELFGYNKEELLYQNVKSFTKVEDFNVEQSNIKLLINDEIDFYNIKRTYRHKNGESLKVNGLVSLIIIDNIKYFIVKVHIVDELLRNDFDILKTILNKSPIIQYIVDFKKQERIYENINLLTYLGYTKKDIGNIRQSDFFKSILDENGIRVSKKIKSDFIKNTDTNKFTENEIYVYNKKKEIIWFKYKTIPLKIDKDGNTLFSYAMVEDITKFKQDEQILIDQKNLLKDISNVIPEFIYLVNRVTKQIIFSNDKCLNVLGYTLNEYMQISQKDLVHKDSIKDIEKYMFSVTSSKTKKYHSCEILAKHKTKGYIWIRYRSIIFERGEEKQTVKILNTIENIHESKIDKISLKEQKTFINEIASKLPTTVYVFNIIKREIEFSNFNKVMILGFTYQYYIQNAKSIVHPNHLVMAVKMKMKLYKSKSNNFVSLEIMLNTKNKGFRWYRIKSKIFERDNNNKPTKILEIIEDIHEERLRTKKILQQENLINNITKSIPEYIYLTDLENKNSIFSNNKCKKVLGYNEKDYFNIEAKYLLTKKSLRLLNNAYYKLYANKKIHDVECELEILHKTKGYRWYRHRIVVFERDEISSKPSLLIKTIEDINDVKLDKIRIQEQKEFIKEISSKLPSAVYVYDLKENKILYSNLSNSKILGYTFNHYLNNFFNIIHPDYSELAFKKTTQIKNKKGNQFLSYEIKMNHNKTGYKWYKFKSKVFKRDEFQNPTQILTIIEDIDNEKNKEILLTESENFVSKIANISPSLILITDIKTNNVIYSNFKNRIFIGYDKKSWISKGKSRIHPKFKKIYQDSIYRLSNNTKNITKKKEYLEIKLKNKNDEYVWISNVSKVFKVDDEGKPSQIMTTITDINDRKLNFFKVLEQQKLINGIANSIPQHLSLWDINKGNCIYTNFENSKILGYTKKEYIKHSQKLVHPDFNKFIIDYGKDILTNIGKNEYSIKYLFKHKTQGYIWVQLKVLIIKRNEKGEAIHSLEILKNINENIQSENKIKEQQNFILKINDTLPNIITIFDLKKEEYIYSNFKKSKFLGFYKNIDGRRPKEYIHFEDIDRYKKIYNKFIVKKSAAPITNEFRIKTKENNYRWVLIISVSFKRDKNGNTSQIMSSFTDIDKQKRLFLELEEQVTKNIELQKFASIASHDLKEPLRTIRNYSQILHYTNRNNLDESGKELLDYIQSSTQRMTELVNDILEFSRIDKTEKKLVKTDLNKLITNVLKDLNTLIKDKKALVSYDKLPTLKVDNIQIRQVFQNLITNAVKFIEDGKNPNIDIKAKEYSNHWEFSIQDNGIGVPKNELENIFGIFKRLHNRKKFQGQGIGLAICKRIIERHKGKIWINSKLGKGTTFYFTIPKS